MTATARGSAFRHASIESLEQVCLVLETEASDYLDKVVTSKSLVDPQKQVQAADYQAQTKWQYFKVIKRITILLLLATFLAVSYFMSYCTFSLLKLDRDWANIGQATVAGSGSTGNLSVTQGHMTSTILHNLSFGAKVSGYIQITGDAWHDLDDEELFLRARNTEVMVRQKFCSTQKVAFLFLTRSTLPMALLWSRFFQGHSPKYSIYIHTNPGLIFRILDDHSLPFPFRKRQIPNKEVEWGAMSLFDAEKRLLANALLDPCNYRFVLLSETCIPLYNFTFVYNFLTSTNLSFVSSFVEDGPNGNGRYNDKLMPEVTIDQFRKSSQWFEMTREVAFIVLTETVYYKKFKEHCSKETCYNDEHYLPTALTILCPNKLANVSVTFVDWSTGGPHPKEFGMEDISVNSLINMRMKGDTCDFGSEYHTCPLFARKFKPSALAKLWEMKDDLGL